jgi:hypothetical protein
MATGTSPEPAPPPAKGLSAWLKKNRVCLQTLMLILALGAPFGLYWALQSGADGVSVAFFAAIVASLTAVIVMG